MKLSDINTFEELVAYLRKFINFAERRGLRQCRCVCAFIAILANISEQHLDSDIDSLKETGYTIGEAERRFLEKLLTQLGSNR